MWRHSIFIDMTEGIILTILIAVKCLRTPKIPFYPILAAKPSDLWKIFSCLCKIAPRHYIFLISGISKWLPFSLGAV